jgi:hypothetical protein
MKVDFKRTLPSYKAARNKFIVIHIPEIRYIMIDGKGDPATSGEFKAAIESLYPVAYGLKFHSKLSLDKDYVVPPLEALWWADDMDAFTTSFDRSQWRWTLMIMTPDWITADIFEFIFETVKAKNKLVTLEQLRFEKFNEGTCVQTLHLGAFSEEGPRLKEMHETFIPEANMQMQGKHHEIYFNDFRRVAPEKLRTILRQPVEALNRNECAAL